MDTLETISERGAVLQKFVKLSVVLSRMSLESGFRKLMRKSLVTILQSYDLTGILFKNTTIDLPGLHFSYIQ